VKFSIRDLLLVTVIVAICVAWWLDRTRLAAEIKRKRLQDYDLKYFHQMLNPSAPAPNPPPE
jgi:hypothetical protein